MSIVTVSSSEVLRLFDGGPPPERRVQRFQLVQVTPGGRFEWLSQHRSRDVAEAFYKALLPGDRVEARIYDCLAATWLEVKS